jgi:hypothetical protein
MTSSLIVTSFDLHQRAVVPKRLEQPALLAPVDSTGGPAAASPPFS